VSSIKRAEFDGDRMSHVILRGLQSEVDVLNVNYPGKQKHISISVTGFLDIPNSMRILYNTFLLTESYVLKSLNS
jgi:hypothetical protein